MTSYVIVENDGPQIVSTNYFETTYNKRGAFYLTINAGAFRLLVPTVHRSAIREFETARDVIISRGPWQGKEALELLFDDHTENPYSIQIATGQFDRLPPADDAGKAWQFSAWVMQAGQLQRAYMSACHYRIVKALPYLKPLGE